MAEKWDWAYTLNTLDLDDVCDSVWILNEGGGSFADAPVQIPGNDGVVLDGKAPFGPMVITLMTGLKWTGTPAHANGAAGHIKENLSKVKAQFYKGLVPLIRTDPHAGRVRAMVKLLTDPAPVSQQHRNVYAWVLLCPAGAWQDNTATTQAAGSVSTSGDKRIPDAILEVGAAGTLTYTSLDGSSYTITVASGPSFPVTIDIGARTITDDDGVDANEYVTFNDPRWLILDPARAQGLGGTAAASSSVTYRNRWG